MNSENGADSHYAVGDTNLTTISIHDGGVHVSVIPNDGVSQEEAKDGETPSLFATRTGFKVLDDNTWIAWYTNAYEDNEGEIFEEKAIAADIDRMNETGDYPELWFWHVRGSRHGKAIAAAKVGRFAVAIGEFDDSKMAHAFKAYYKARDGMALSHGFFYDPDDKVDGVFAAYNTFEISVLPPDSAANPYTAYSIKEKDVGEMSEQAKAAFIEVLGKAEAEELFNSGKAATKVLDELGVAYKTETPAQKGDKPDSGEDEEMDMKAIMVKMVETMSKMEARLSEMEGKANPDDDEEEPEEEEKSGKSRSEQADSPSNDRFLQLLAEAIAGKSAKSIEDRKQADATPAESLWSTLVGEGK